jgi:hypothetical protein
MLLSTSASDSKKCIRNLSKQILSDSEEAVLMKCLNLSITNSHSNMDMACFVQSVVSKCPQTLGTGLRWNTRPISEKSKSSMTHMTKKGRKP